MRCVRDVMVTGVSTSEVCERCNGCWQNMVKMLGSAWPARCIVMSCWTGSAPLGSRLTFGCLQGWTEARMIQGGEGGGGRDEGFIN